MSNCSASHNGPKLWPMVAPFIGCCRLFVRSVQRPSRLERTAPVGGNNARDCPPSTGTHAPVTHPDPRRATPVTIVAMVLGPDRVASRMLPPLVNTRSTAPHRGRIGLRSSYKFALCELVGHKLGRSEA
jgi:hypothetical protein